MYALQQVKNGRRVGKVWVFETRELAQESVVLTYQTQEVDSLLDTRISIDANFVQVSTDFMGTLYFVINEVIASDEAIFLE